MTTSNQTTRDARTIRTLRGVILALLLPLAAVSFAAGAVALTAAGEAAKLGLLSFAIPFTIDGGQVIFAAAALVLRAEGRHSRLPWFMVVLLTATSVTVQANHILAGRAMNVSTIATASVACLLPIVLLTATKVLESAWFGAVIDRAGETDPAPRPRQPRKTITTSTTTTKAVSAPIAGQAVSARPAVAASASHTADKLSAAVARLANESERNVAADTGISRYALRNAKKALSMPAALHALERSA
ncbi:MAG TPA: DUF2637 domain-containing protein [Galbitalea sp.]